MQVSAAAATAVFAYADMYAGMALGRCTVHMSRERVLQFLRATGDVHPAHVNATALPGWPHGSDVVPPVLLANYSHVRHTLPGRVPDGTLHVSEELSLHAPLPVGSTVEYRTRVVEVYLRKERRYVVLVTDALDAIGTVAARLRGVYQWGA